MLIYRVGDATNPAERPAVIAHIVNDRGGWGRGFTGGLGARYPEAVRSYRVWAGRETSTPFELGRVLMVEVEVGVWVAHMLAQQGYRSSRELTPLRYEALRLCIKELDERVQSIASDVTLHMPMVGAGLGGGDWGRIEGILKELRVQTYVYTLPVLRCSRMAAS